MDHSLDQETLPDAGHGEPRLAPLPTATAADDGTPPTSLLFPTAVNASRSTGAPARAVWVWAICGFLLLAVGLVFGQTVRHEFVGFDDNDFVYENQHITAGLTLPGLWWAFTDGPVGEWTPLSTLSSMLDCQLYGVNPGGHHLTNVLLHAASSVLLFLVLLRMTGDLWPSAWVAAVFAIHPLHVESVAWAAERRDTLSGLFFMLTLGAYALYAERPSLARYLAVAGCLALGLMAKPMLVTIPLVLLLLDYWPLERMRRAAGARPTERVSWFGRLPVGWRLVVEKLPLLVLAALSCGMTLWTHSSVRSTNPVERLSLATRLANGLVSYAVYLGQSFFPSDLAPFYPHPGVRLSTAAVGGALLLLLAITAIAAYGWRRLPYVLVGWLWFLGMLVPVIGLMQICAHARADRYTYLSQIGLSIALAWGVWSIYRARQAIAAAPWRRWTLAAVSVGTVLALAAMAWRQTTYWRNAETLWTHTLACTEQNVLAHYNLGYTYAMQGNTAEAISQLRDAVAGQSIEPIVIAKSHGLLADSLTKQGEFDEALAHYEQAVRIYAEGAIFHDRLAQALARRNNHERAVVEFREVVRLAPNYWQARVGLAASLLARGETREAIVQCREALDHDPTAVKASVILGEALATEGQPEEALAPLRRALDLQPDNAQAHFHLGLVLGELGRSRPAIDHLDEAVRLRPDDVAMLGQMAWLLATSPNASMRDGARAVELANRAVKLSGGQQPHPFDALAAALAEAGQFPAAIAAAEQAATLAEARGDEALVGAIQQRTRLYRQDLPYRQPTSSASGNPARLRIK